MRAFPDRGADGDGLTQRQRRVLEVIRDSIERRGYPPSVREIGEAVGLSSASSVAHQLSVLQKKGWLRRDPNRPRALDVRLPGDSPHSVAAAELAAGGEAAGPAPTYVPLVGRIAAGGPVLAEQAVEDVFPLPRELVGEGTLFMLKVVGDSMVDAAICDGDWVVVRQQPHGGERRDRGGDDRRRGDGQDLQAPRRARLADAAQPRVRADPRRRRDRARPRRQRPAPRLTPAADRRLEPPVGGPPVRRTAAQLAADPDDDRGHGRRDDARW